MSSEPFAVLEPDLTDPDLTDNVIRYDAEWTPSLLHNSKARFRGIRGPWGSGKSVGCVMELWMKAKAQRSFKGIRSSRWMIVRNTYQQLITTSLADFQAWIPPSLCRIKRGTVMGGLLRQPLPDNTTVECEIYFISLDRPKDIRKLLSLQLTGIWINEAREIDKSIVVAALGRLGRFPKKDQGGPSWTGCIADTNSPDTEHWWYDCAENASWKKYQAHFDEARMREQLRIHLGDASDADGIIDRVIGETKDTTLEDVSSSSWEWEFFAQPGGLIPAPDGRGYIQNPSAENIQHLPMGYGYYFNMLPGRTKDQIKVDILAEYGSVFTGRPVYEGIWIDARHRSKDPLQVLKTPIYLFFDWGNTPACLAVQLNPAGQLRVLREWCIGDKGGARQLLRDMVLPGCRIEFPGIPIAGGWGDPAGEQSSQADTELDCFRVCNDPPPYGFGLRIVPACKTNDFPPRRAAVIDWLQRNVGDQPAVIVDPSCTTFLRGMNGGYQFSRIQSVGDERYRDVPLKNKYSHPCEAFQYGCIGLSHLATINMRHNNEPHRPPIDSGKIWRALTS